MLQHAYDFRDPGVLVHSIKVSIIRAPFPTNPLAVRSLLPASLPLESFEEPLSCLRPHPKHQGLHRSARAAPSQSPGAAPVSMTFFWCNSFSALRTSLA